jgi:hypothetical protein
MWSQPYLIDQMIRQHQKELLAKAEKARSVREALEHRESQGRRWSLRMLLQRLQPVRRGTGVVKMARKTLATVPDGLAHAGESPAAGAIAALCSDVGGDSKLPQCS